MSVPLSPSPAVGAVSPLLRSELALPLELGFIVSF